MKSWSFLKLKEVTTVVGGGTPKTSINEYWADDIVWLSPSDLPEIGEIVEVSDSIRKISNLGLEKSSAKLLPIGTVCFSSRASIGKIGISTVELATNQGFKNFICKKNLYNKFLAYVLKYLTPQIVELSNSTTFKEISTTAIKNVKIPLPPLPEQRRIVSKLDVLFAEIDASLALIDQNIEQTEALKLSVLDEEFSIDNEKLKIKDEELKNIVQVIGGGTPKKSIKEFYQGDIPWASVRDLNVIQLKETEYYITNQAIENSSTNVIPKGNLIIATRVGLGKIVYNEIDVAINQDLKGLILSEKINRGFLFYYFKSIENFIIDSGTGATVKGVKLDFIKSLKVPLPDLKTQQKIVQKLDSLFEEIDGLVSDYKQKREDLEALRASLLDVAFRGEL